MGILEIDPVVDDKEYGLKAGRWSIHIIVATGPVLLQRSKETGGTFTTKTDGTVSATSDVVMDWGEGDIFKMQLEAGDSAELKYIGA